MVMLIFGIAIVAATAQASSPQLLQSALNPNPGLRSYIASATLVARAHPIPVKRTFDGTAYYLNRSAKIVFDNVPKALQSLRVLTTTLPSYDRAVIDYTIAPQSDDGNSSTFLLLPKNVTARVKSVSLTVDDRKQRIAQVVWQYKNGSSLSIAEQYQTTASFELPAKVDIAASFPGYRVDGTIHLKSYRVNVDIPPAIFSNR